MNKILTKKYFFFTSILSKAITVKNKGVFLLHKICKMQNVLNKTQPMLWRCYIPYFLKQCPPLNSVPFFEKAQYIKKEHFSNFCIFEIASLVNVPGRYLEKYGMYDVFTYDECYTYCKFDHQSINDTSHHRDEIKGVP